jgi:hypothetical protein
VEKMLDEFDEEYSKMQSQLINQVSACVGLKSEKRKQLLDTFFEEVSRLAETIVASEAFRHVKRAEEEQASTFEKPVGFGIESKAFNPNVAFKELPVATETKGIKRPKGNKENSPDKKESPVKEVTSSTKKPKKNQSSSKRKKAANRNKENSV